MANEQYVPAPDIYIPGSGESSDDFIGFSFNGVESSDLGIVRTSVSDRYNDTTIPNFQDKSAQMPGSDYTLYWESFYNTRNWTVNIAFDHMTETQLRLFRRTFNAKNIGELYFKEKTYSLSQIYYPDTFSYDDVDVSYEGVAVNEDPIAIEEDHIYYLAKVQSPPQLNYLCFEEDGERIYKGEGTIQFVAYFPFGIRKVGFENMQGVPGIKGVVGNAEIVTFIVQNKGDIDMDWILSAHCNRAHDIQSIIIRRNGNSLYEMLFENGIPCPSNEETNLTYILFNSKSQLIETGLWNGTEKDYNYTGKVYNSALTEGDFFKVPADGQTYEIVVTHTNVHNGNDYLYYRYLYL